VISLVGLIWLAYRGWSVVLIAPLLALVACIFNVLGTGNDLMAGYTNGFMPNLANYVKTYFPIFMLGAVFGKMMDDSGSARAIANFIMDKLGPGKEVIATVVTCAILTYGGVSLFVVVFAVYPIAAAMFRRADLPKRLIAPAIALGAFTFTMTAIPGTPQIQNAIPMPFFGTDVFAAPVLGVIAAVIMAGGGLWWLNRQEKKMRAAGEGYGNHPNEDIRITDDMNLPSFGISLVPIIFVLIANFVFSKVVMPNNNIVPENIIWTDSAQVPDGDHVINIAKSGVIGNWSLIWALVIGIILVILFNFKRYENVPTSLKNGVSSSFLAILNTASEVGYGNVIKTLAGFTVVATGMQAISGGSVLVLDIVSTSTLAGITGSASGGMSIALSVFGEQMVTMANNAGISPEALHRVCSVASGGLDTLPHNGAVLTLLAATGLTHRESYKNMCVCTVIIPLIAAFIIAGLGTLGVN
jgi:H+/gluconate symporter-like permease